MNRPSNFKIHGALFLATAIYGASYTISKEAMPVYIQPTGFILVRVGGALAVLAAIHRAKVHESIKSTKDYFYLALLGFYGVAFNMVMFFQGLSRTSPIDASLIIVTTPIFVLIIGFIARFEKITWLKVSGIVIGTLGAALLIMQGNSSKQSSWQGDLMIVANSASYAVYLVIVRPIMRRYHYLTVMVWCFLFGFIFVTPFGIGQLLDVQWHTFTPGVWFSVIFTILCTTILTYTLNAWALQYVKSSVVGSYVYLQPIIATLIATSTGKYSLGWHHIVLASLILGGVYMVSRKDDNNVPVLINE